MAKKSASDLISPDRQMFFSKKSRSLTFLAEGYLTRGASRWSWTILKVNIYILLKCRKNRARMEHDFFYFAPIKSFTIVYSPMVLNLLYRSVINSSSESLRSSVREVFRHFSISSDCCLTSL
jgi:hypothetical protein